MLKIISTVENWLRTMMSGESVLLSLLSAVIGTALGAYLINRHSEKKSEEKIKGVREIATKMLALLKKYAKTGNTYQTAKSDFNNTFTVTEKRAVLVSVYKVGVPIEMPIEGRFDIKDINFSSHPVDEKEIDGMIVQIEKGNCDHLFYSDVDAFFSDGMRTRLLRDVAKRYVTQCLEKASLINNNTQMQFPEDHLKNFTFGEFRTLLTFGRIIMDVYYFDKQGHIKKDKTAELLSEIDRGLWDIYLQWDYTAYSSMLSQTAVNEEFLKITSFQNALNQNPVLQQATPLENAHS